MRREPLKRFFAAAITLLLLAGLTGVSFADTNTKPYIKAFGGDVMTGGWINDGTNCSTSTSSNYQSFDSNVAGYTADTRNGGILTYTKTKGSVAGGSSVQYGAISLGEVDGRDVGNGFYSDAGQASGTAVKNLTFANTVSGLGYGGEFEGSVRQSNCIPDYYGTQQRSPQPCCAITAFGDSIDLNNANGQYIMTPAAGQSAVINPNGLPIPAGRNITVFVNGNAYINNNITYAAGATVANVPKFALVVKGSIYIDKGATRLDGMYVAQPSGKTAATIKADDGVIWTCHPNSTAALDYTYPPNCDKTLVVNGALIAKQVSFLRIIGDIGSANTAEDNLGTVSDCASSCNLSEVVNYSPAMIMGGSFFKSNSAGSSSTGLPVDSVISLPPVF